MLSISLLWGKETDGRIHGEKVGGGWGVSFTAIELPLLVGLGTRTISAPQVVKVQNVSLFLDIKH